MEITDDHVQALKIVLREVLREELKLIFERSNLLSGAAGSTEHTILCALSAISKVHEENALGNKIDKALANAFDVYKSVAGMEQQLIEEIVKKHMKKFRENVASAINNTPTI